MKAQVSVEFMAFVSILLLLLLLFVWNSFSLQKEMIALRSDTEARKLSDRIAFEINTALKAGNGYSRNFYVEDSFAGISDFDILVNSYSVVIKWSQGSASSQILTENITGSIKKGWNFIQNKNGEIFAS